MANSKSTTTVAFLLALNLVFFSLVSASGDCPKSKPNELASAKTAYSCPIDALKLAVCANLLGGAVGAIIGTPPSTPCCTLIGGLVDLEAAACLCTAIRTKALGINLNVLLSLSVILNACGKKVPEGFKCD